MTLRTVETIGAVFLAVDGGVTGAIGLAFAWSTQGVSLVILGPVAAVILWAAWMVWSERDPTAAGGPS